jgi:dolichol-phosphate mannosyltransferase
MDPDLQDPPDEIPRFVSKIEEGYDLVFGIRKEKMDSGINKIYSKIFWGTLNRFTGLKIPKGLAVMRIFNRKFADKFVEYSEQNRFIEGIFIHIGMKRTEIEVSQRNRFAGKSKFNFKRKMELAFNAIFDFSELPLRLAVNLGISLSFLGLIALIVIAYIKFFIFDFAAGWPSLLSAIVLSLGLQLFFIGIAAIYIGKIYKESKGRPLFSIKEFTNFE